MTLSRRSLITGLISLVAAPAIVRVSSIMPVKQMVPALQVSPIMFQGRFFWVEQTNPCLVRWAAVQDASAWIVDAYNSAGSSP